MAKKSIAQAVLEKKRKLMAEGGSVSDADTFTMDPSQIVGQTGVPQALGKAAQAIEPYYEKIKPAVDLVTGQPIRNAIYKGISGEEKEASGADIAGALEQRVGAPMPQFPGASIKTKDVVGAPIGLLTDPTTYLGVGAAKPATRAIEEARPAAKAVQEAAPEVLNLYHYSSQPNLGTISPEFAGTGFDARTRGRNMENKLSHYFHDDITTGQDAGLIDQAPHKYKTQVEANKVYDITNDPAGIIAKTQQKYPGFSGSQLIDQSIPEMKAAGYEGLRAPGNTANPHQVSLFVEKPAIPVNEYTKAIEEPHFLFTADSPKVEPKVKTNTAEIANELQKQGFKVSHVPGKYGTEENSLMVHNVTPEQAEKLHELARNLGQESSLYRGANGVNEMRYLNGPSEGYSALGKGTAFHPEAPEDFYSKLGEQHFTHKLDFGNPVLTREIKENPSNVLQSLGRMLGDERGVIGRDINAPYGKIIQKDGEGAMTRGASMYQKGPQGENRIVTSSKGNPQFGEIESHPDQSKSLAQRIMELGDKTKNEIAAKLKDERGSFSWALKDNKSSYALPEVKKALQGVPTEQRELVLSNDGNAYEALMKAHPELKDDENWASTVIHDMSKTPTAKVEKPKYYDVPVEKPGKTAGATLDAIKKKNLSFCNPKDYDTFEKFITAKDETGEPIGALGLGSNQETTSIMVDPEHQGQGIAQGLYKKALQREGVLRSSTYDQQLAGGAGLWRKFEKENPYHVRVARSPDTYEPLPYRVWEKNTNVPMRKKEIELEKQIDTLRYRKGSAEELAKLIKQHKALIKKSGHTMYYRGGEVQGYADGGEVSPEGSDQMSMPQVEMPQMAAPQAPVDGINVFDPNGELISIPHHQLADALNQGYTEASDEDVSKHFNEQQYGGAGQTAIAGLEGLAQGIAGPLATGAELGLGLTTGAAMRGREQASPIAHGVGEAAGLVGGLMSGTGIAPLAERAGVAVAGRALGEAAVAEGASLIPKIGSAAVKGSIENMVIQSGNEVSKMLMQDPEQSGGTAAVDIGLSGLLGGGIMAGASTISPLWHATVGNKVGQVLGKLSDKAGGIENVLSSDMNAVLEKSGITLEPEIRAALSNDRAAQEAFMTLNQSDTTSSGLKLQEAVKNFKTNVQHGMAESLGVTPEMLQKMPEVNRYEHGKRIGEILADEYKAKLDPVVDMFETLKSKYSNADILPSVEAKAEEANKILDRARIDLNKANKGLQDALKNQDVGTAIELQNTVTELSERVKTIQKMAKTPGTSDTVAAQLAELADKEGWHYNDEIMGHLNKTIEQVQSARKLSDLPKIATAVGDKMASKLPFGAQDATSRAGMMIKNVLREAESEAAMTQLGKEAPELVEQYKLARAKYAEASKLKDALDDRLHVRGSTSSFPKTLKEMARTDGEAIVRKLSGKDDADLLKLLNERFPATAKAIKDYHLATVLEKAASKAKEGEVLSPSHLMKAVDGMDVNLRNFTIPEAAQTRLNALGTLLNKMNEIPTHNFSNTARTMDKLMSHLPASAGAMVAMLTGHGVGAALLAGPMIKLLAKDAPDAVRLAMLKWLGSGKEIKPAAFANMVEYITAVQKGAKQLESSTKAVFKAGKMVLPESMMPSTSEKAKLDKQVQAMQVNPEKMMRVGGDTSHYMPEHGAQMASMAANAVQYLNGLRPNTDKLSPLDSKPIANPMQKAEYDRALGIAQRPLIVLDKIQKGTIVPQDIIALKTMYPGLYTKMATQLMNNMNDVLAKGHTIPYQTRIGLSMFTAQALDSTMQPTAIQNAQPMGTQQQPNQQQGKPPAASSVKGLTKMPQTYLTPDQARLKEQGQGK